MYVFSKKFYVNYFVNALIVKTIFHNFSNIKYTEKFIVIFDIELDEKVYF